MKVPPKAAILAEAGIFRNEYTAEPPICEKQSEGKRKRRKANRILTIIAQSKESFICTGNGTWSFLFVDKEPVLFKFQPKAESL
jgi:hypothetical protein